jgi:DNA damage-binding protein 1
MLMLLRRDTHLLISTLHSTRLFALDSTSVLARMESSAFVANTRTLAAGHLVRRDVQGAYGESSLIAQVAPGGVVIAEYTPALRTHSRLSIWKPADLADGWGKDKEIVGASLSASQLVLALSGCLLVLLNLDTNEKCNLNAYVPSNYISANVVNLKYRKKVLFSAGDEIAAVSCTPLDSSKNYSTHFAVASWRTHVVEVLQTTRSENAQAVDLTTICRTEPMSSLPRSLLLYNFGLAKVRKEEDYRPYLLAGLADGSLVSYVFDPKERKLKDKRMVSLGTTPVALVPITVNERPSVCACGTRASFFFFVQGRLRHSPILVNVGALNYCLSSTYADSPLRVLLLLLV